MRIEHLALIAGLTPLIPVPFLDRWAHRRVLRRMYTEVGATDPGPLVERKDSLVGRVLLSLLWWPVRKLLRTLFFFLTLKECVDLVADAALRVEMVRRVLPVTDPARARTLLDEVTADSSPLERLFHDRPSGPAVGVPGQGMTAQLVRWLQSLGGGAMVIHEFERRFAAED